MLLVCVCARSDSCLIIQNKGGGHGEIGYHLALQLAQEKDMVRARLRQRASSLRYSAECMAMRAAVPLALARRR